MLKLHLGCGEQYKEGWINIDDNNDHRIDMKWDLRTILPFAGSSVHFIYHEHFLEHLTAEDGLSFLKECYRLLIPRGVMRVAMPDLKEIIEQYLDPNWKERQWLKTFGMEFVQTKAELINISFRWWGHQYLYDKEELERRLGEVGFKQIKFCELKKSVFPELIGLETREESTLIAEVIK